MSGVSPSLHLPAGLTLNPATGVISGTIPFGVGGLLVVQVTAAVRGQTVSQTFVWTIRRNDPPTLTNPGDQGSTIGTGVHLHLVAVDPNGDPLTYGVSSSHPLPPGLSLDPATRWISGQPLGPVGRAGVTVKVQDVWGVRASQTFTWIVRHPPTFGNIPDQISAAGDHQRVQVDATPGTDGDRLTYSAAGLPDGLTINPRTGLIAGITVASADERAGGDGHGDGR